MQIHAVSDTRNLSAVDARTFLGAMSHTVSGVAIITTNGACGRFGLTVSSLVSVSAEPPSLLFCVNRQSAAHDAIRDNARFGVNVLAAEQVALADTFAGRDALGRNYRFDDARWSNLDDLPRLFEASAFFECALESAAGFGTHTIFVGRVLEAHAHDDKPLLYSGRRYGRPADIN